MKIVNLTPHAIVYRSDANAPEIVFPPSGQVARLQTHTEDAYPIAAEIEGHPVFAHLRTSVVSFAGVEGCPPPQSGTLYIVSGMVLDAVRGNMHYSHLIAPDTGSTAGRDERGQIQYVTGFRVNA